MKTPLTKRARKAAKRLFPRKPHSTRAFTSADYAALTKEGPHEVNLGGSNGNRSALGHGV